MGLDIAVVPALGERVEIDHDDPDDAYNRGLVHVHNPDFKGREAPLTEGWYEPVGDGAYGFRAGSYGGYNAYRAALSLMAHGVDPDTIWADREAWKGKPFYEQIDFSDCEGTLGPGVCAKLALDYDDHVGKAAVAWAGEDDGMLRRYKMWQEAFKRAAGTGVVIYA